MIKDHSSAYHIPFIGRKRELADITARLVDPDCRLLTLTGLGGSGKTRLAIEAAAIVAPRFPHGAVFVALQPLTRSDLLVPAIAQSVGLTFDGAGELHQQLLDYLQDKTLLVILDNFEHVLEGAALVTTMLAAAPGLKVVVTSRAALRLHEEWLFPLEGLSTPLSVYAPSLEDYEAVQLFLYHARRVRPDFDSANERESVIRICQMTAGLPLAIELAASWLKGSSTTHICSAIQRNLDVLSTTARNVEERHRSMRAVFDHSWTLLSEPERLIFAGLSIFPGGFDGEAASQVAHASFAGLAALVEKSLVQLASADRFTIHEMLRQYGMEQLEAYGATEATYARHSQYFAQMMLRHERAFRQPRQLDAIQAIERDWENIRLAWEWSARRRHVTQLHAMLNGLYLFGFLRSRSRETITIFQHTLEQYVADAPLRGRLLARRWGYLHWSYEADYQEALTSIEQALTIARGDTNRFEIAFGHLMTGYVMISMQRYSDALPHLEASQALFDELEEPYYVCWVLHRLGYVYTNLNDIERGNDYTERSLALARVTHNRFALVICLYNLGSDDILRGDYEKGRRCCAEALQIATEVGHQGQIAHASSLLALCAFVQGDFTACQDYAERSLTIIEDLNQLRFQPFNLAVLMLLACLREDYAEGVRLNDIAQRFSTNTMGYQLLYWAQAALACGVGNPAAARVYIQNALHLAVPELNPGPLTWLVPCVAYTLAETDPEQAVELLAWICSSADSALQWVRHWPLFDRLQTRLQDALERDAYQLHWEHGKALSFDAVNSYVQHEFRIASESGSETADDHLLTAREREILRLLAAGMTNPQIAAQLIIGAGTVKTHTLHIYRKLDVANRMQAVARAQEAGLLGT